MSKGFVKNYWESRYKRGGNSGLGSHDTSAINFKANYVNQLIKDDKHKTVIELGCGDGNQLGLLEGYEKYVGSDISETTIENCSEMYEGDSSKIFEHNINKFSGETFDLSLSLDVIYHLVEDEVFEEYMKNMFNLSNNVCLYTTNEDKETNTPHIKHRDIEKYVGGKYSDFELVDKTPFHKYNVMFLLYKRK